MNELSTINKSMKLINPILLAIVGVIVSYGFLKSNHLWFLISAILIFGFCILYYKKVTSNVVELYFDSEFLLLESYNNSRKIKIDNIKSLKSTSHRIKILGFPFHKYRIDFINEHSIRETVKFWVGAYNMELEKFQSIINSKTK